MNKLYSILVKGRDTASSWYRKRTSSVAMTTRAEKMTSLLMPASCDAALCACCICRFAMLSSFWSEIRQLDSMNTYEQPPRNGEVASALPSGKDLDRCVALLDKGLRERISSSSVAERIGACCLQLLEDCCG